MNINEFIDNCNKSPLFKKGLSITITKKLLHELNFIQKEYLPERDILQLNRYLFFTSPQLISSEKDSVLKKREVLRNMQHVKLISIHNNQKLLKKIRRDLKMPFDNRGFILPEKNVQQKNYVNVLLNGLSKEYKEWLMNFINNISEYKKSTRKKFYVADILNKEIDKSVSFLLKKWELQSRYHDAIVELILFNRIIPADPNISFRSNFLLQPNEKPRMSIEFDVDTTKDELMNFIINDPFHLFTGQKKVIKAKIKRSSKKDEETEDMIQIYNKYKGEGKKDNDAIKAVRLHFASRNLSESAIRKRIKGK